MMPRIVGLSRGGSRALLYDGVDGAVLTWAEPVTRTSESKVMQADHPVDEAADTQTG